MNPKPSPDLTQLQSSLDQLTTVDPLHDNVPDIARQTAQMAGDLLQTNVVDGDLPSLEEVRTIFASLFKAIIHIDHRTSKRQEETDLLAVRKTLSITRRFLSVLVVRNKIEQEGNPVHIFRAGQAEKVRTAARRIAEQIGYNPELATHVADQEMQSSIAVQKHWGEEVFPEIEFVVETAEDEQDLANGDTPEERLLKVLFGEPK